ncbi:MAG TPA: SpoIIE family protein phosphatase [Bacteroidia bacterium]|nr:SpoIIE family protein phosphatase [Bacteroidia bacterium]
MKQTTKILLLEDCLSDVILLQRVLIKSDINCVLQVVDTENDFVEKLDKFKPDVVLSDHALPSFNSMEALEHVRSRGLDIPFILVTGTVSEEFAVTCMKAGADDYILKDRLYRLPVSIQTALARKRISKEKEIIELLHKRIQTAFNQLTERNENILQSIHYAQRIQESMFPNQTDLRTYFPRSFLLNKPKDIIGGDFCWMMEQGDRFYMAVADCTGHGVPGALLSVLGFNHLRSIAQSNPRAHPGEILEILNVTIHHALRQDRPENPGHDGMDIALCIIDRKTNKVEFSGANRPLYLVRKKEFSVIKGTKCGVGGQDQGHSRVFNTHTFPCDPGDKIYLSTDGYADQFGGKNDKKMMVRNLNKLFQTSHSFDILEQQQLLIEWFNNWKGDQEQTDDILIAGIEL